MNQEWPFHPKHEQRVLPERVNQLTIQYSLHWPQMEFILGKFQTISLLILFSFERWKPEEMNNQTIE